MIPDFKTYINETYWSDMNKRSQGTRIRKEDNVNRLTSENMVDFLNDRYGFYNDFQDFDIYSYNKNGVSTIHIPVASEDSVDNRCVEVKYKQGSSEIIQICLDTRVVEEVPVVLNALKNQFDVEIKKEWGVVDFYPVGYVYPKGSKELSNKFLIEVLDFIADLDTDKKSIVRK